MPNGDFSEYPVSNGYVAPGYQGMAQLPQGVTIGGEGGIPAGLGRDELNALIQFRQQQLAAQQQQAAAQNALAGRQLDQQGGQFGQQLDFNRMVQQAQAAATEKARVSAEINNRATQQNTQIGLQQQEEQARQAQAQTSYAGYDASEIARRGQEINQTQFGATNELARRAQLAGEAMSKANLSASLRGPANAFKQLEVNGLMNSSGLGTLSSILTGGERVPSFQAPGGTPEAATLGTLSRDMGENQQPGDWHNSGIFTAPTSLALDPNGGKGMAGMLGLGDANRDKVPPYDPNDPYWMARREAIQNGEINQRLSAQPGIGPGTSMGAEILQGFPALLAKRGGQAPAYDDPELLQLYMTAAERAGVPISVEQAKVATRYAADYYTKNGTPLDEGKLNDMIGGQVARGQPIDPSKWRPYPGQPAAGATMGTQVQGQQAFADSEPGRMQSQTANFTPNPGQVIQTTQSAPGQYVAAGVNPITDASAGAVGGATTGALPNQGYANDFLSFLSKTPPNKINAYAFNKLKTSAQDFTLGGYEALGYDKADVAGDIQKLLPTATGPKRGYIAPAGRAA